MYNDLNRELAIPYTPMVLFLQRLKAFLPPQERLPTPDTSRQTSRSKKQTSPIFPGARAGSMLPALPPTADTPLSPASKAKERAVLLAQQDQLQARLQALTSPNVSPGKRKADDMALEKSPLATAAASSSKKIPGSKLPALEAPSPKDVRGTTLQVAQALQTACLVS
jgi:hypothetical protein